MSFPEMLKHAGTGGSLFAGKSPSGVESFKFRMWTNNNIINSLVKRSRSEHLLMMQQRFVKLPGVQK